LFRFISQWFVFYRAFPLNQGFIDPTQLEANPVRIVQFMDGGFLG
jgi:hypothetical protein